MSARLARQRGLSLVGVAIGSGLLALVAMAALYSMRHERNLFAEGAAKVTDKIGDAAKSGMQAAKADGDGVMRRCTIKGKTVISNTECASNANSKVIAIHDTKGFEAPKVPPKEAATPGSDPMIDKMIEKQLR